MRKDYDLAWLECQRPEDDLLDIQSTLIPRLYNIIALSEKSDWPMNVGLFGGWGSGKTSALSYLAEHLASSNYQEEAYDLIYFDVGKYVSVLEILPTLIHKLLKKVPNETSDESAQRILLSLGIQHTEQLCKWSEKYLGVDPVKIIKGTNGITNDIQAAAHCKDAVDKYYSQLDQAQELLAQHLQDRKAPIVVLLDNLDSCPPAESFEILSNLRHLFSAQGTPLIFLFGANPAPFYSAIKRKFNLEDDTYSSQAKRIFEKYIDAYMDMLEPISLGNFVKTIWRGHPIEALSTIHSINRHWAPTDPLKSTFKNADIFASILSSNTYYNNLRALKKSHKHIVLQHSHKTRSLWTCWHLEILKQLHPKQRHDIAKLATIIGEITALSHFETIRTLQANKAFDRFGKINTNLLLETTKGSTAFSIYRICFFERIENLARCTATNKKSGDLGNTLQTIQSITEDKDLLEFIVILSLMPMSHDDTSFTQEVVNNPKIDRQWYDEPAIKELTDLLENY